VSERKIIYTLSISSNFILQN